MIDRRQRRSNTGSARDAIRDAAASLFAEKGFSATSTREICERARVTKPVLYYHFGSKGDLYQALVQDAFNEYQREVRRATHRGRNTRDKLVEILYRTLAFAQRNQNEYRLAVRMVVAPEKETPEIDFVEMSRADEQVLTEVLQEGRRKGELMGQPQQIAAAISGIAFAYVLGFLVSGQPPLNRKLARDTIDLILAGCLRKHTDR